MSAFKVIYDKSSRLERGSFVVSLLGLLFSLPLVGTSHAGFLNYKVPIYLFGVVFFFYPVVSALLRYASSENPSSRIVASASTLALLMILIAFYAGYFLIAGTTPSGAGDRILNLAPVFAAMWAATVGWFIHTQGAQRNHRVANAFNLVMQTRTSSEYQKRVAAMQRNCPHGSELCAQEEYYKADAIKVLSDTLCTLRVDEEKNKKAILEAKKQLGLVRSVEAIKYLLNYFEFLAVGIQRKEVEEELVYDTMGATVVSIWDRAEPYIAFVNSTKKGDQVLAFCELRKLVTSWKSRVHDEESAAKKLVTMAAVARPIISATK